MNATKSAGRENKGLKSAVNVVTAVFWASFFIGWGAATLLVLLAASEFFYKNSWLFFSLIEFVAISWLVIIILVWAKPSKSKGSRRKSSISSVE